MNDIHESRGYMGMYQWIPTYTKNVVRRQMKSSRHYDKLGNLGPNAVWWYNEEMVMVPCKNKAVPLADAAVSSQWPIWRSGAELRDDAEEQAVRQLYSKLANANALLPLMFKERQSTIDLVTSKVQELTRIKRNFRKRIKHLWKKHDNRAVHNAWLEYRYGWMPTLMDVDTLINKPLGLPSMSAEGSGFRRNQWTLKDGTSQIETYAEYHVKTKAYATPKSPFMQSATQYGIANPSLVLWEAVPYSFVVDWFLDIGGYLESLGALNGIEIISPFTSYRTSWSQQVNVPEDLSVHHGYSHWRGKSGTRVLGLPSYPNPLIPSNGLNLTRFADSVALLRNLFKK